MDILPIAFRFRELSELPALVKQLLEIGKDFPIWFFEGDMGAGKTTLIKSLCATLGVSSAVHSPTFSIVNEYITLEGALVYHFDFYRLKDEMEALDIGIEEYFDSGNYCFVEWPQKIEALWPERFLHIQLVSGDDGTRILSLKKIGTNV